MPDFIKRKLFPSLRLNTNLVFLKIYSTNKQTTQGVVSEKKQMNSKLVLDYTNNYQLDLVKRFSFFLF